MKGDLFKEIAQVEYSKMDPRTKKIDTFKMPILYYDGFCMNALYTASTSLVRQYLPDPQMHPLEIKGGRTLVSITAFEYRKTDIKPYNEFSIAILISYGKKGLPFLSLMSQKFRSCYDMYIWHLPVTTEIARRGGVDLYGFPKFLAGIDFTHGSNKTTCVVSEKKKHIITLEGPVLPVKQGSTIRYNMYPVYQGITVLGRADFLNHQFSETRDTGEVRLTIGDGHPLCSELKSIDLSPKPFLYQYIPSCESVLYGPRNLSEIRKAA